MSSNLPVALPPARRPDGPKPRAIRSKSGCGTCKRRKVSCNERRPRCGHCERLNLECTWERPAPRRNNHHAQKPYPAISLTAAPASYPPLNAGDALGFSGAAGYDFTGGNNLIWDEAMLLSPMTLPIGSSAATIGSLPDMTISQTFGTPLEHRFARPNGDNAGLITSGVTSGVTNERDSFSSPDYEPQNQLAHFSAAASEGPDDQLVQTFLEMFMPPILVPVETGPKWEVTRAFFASMAEDSSVVRSAIKAFASMQQRRKEMTENREVTADWQTFYDNAYRDLSAVVTTRGNVPTEQQTGLQYILASLFLLIYTDLIAETLPRAHANLREAYDLIHGTDKESFSLPERRLISWIRLLDARAVSTAGGEGLFLADTDDSTLGASPAPETSIPPGLPDISLEEILFDTLYQPGIVFYQKVQSFAGRIARIDLWHRSRGTVQDETEVMGVARQITKDLKALYNQRPALMDHCVAGHLTDRWLAKDLAAPLTRSFRTYLANYYASFIHLQRVAYVPYPRTDEVVTAVANIRSLSQSMAEMDEALPVNLLWPLLMWGCEEDDLQERQWILSSIRSLTDLATNARVTADLLEEVQRRQDASGKRVDVRGVSHECFASYHFPIV